MSTCSRKRRERPRKGVRDVNYYFGRHILLSTETERERGKKTETVGIGSFVV